MNVEQAYIKSIEKEMVTRIVKRRLTGELKDMDLSNQIKVPDSYSVVLANDPKRKIAVSSPKQGWITIIESKEVNDYTLLSQISKELQAEVLAVVQSDVTGAWGFVEILGGEVVESYFNEEDDEIENLIEKKLKEKKIEDHLYMFREVIRERGWDII